MSEVMTMNGFNELKEQELYFVDGGWTAEQWIVGACTVGAGLIGCAVGGPVCGYIGVETGTVAGIAICAALGLVAGGGANALAKDIIN